MDTNENLWRRNTYRLVYIGNTTTLSDRNNKYPDDNIPQIESKLLLQMRSDIRFSLRFVDLFLDLCSIDTKRGFFVDICSRKKGVIRGCPLDFSILV